MKVQLKPDREIRTETIRIGRMPVLVLRPAEREPAPEAIRRFHEKFERAMACCR